MGKGVWPRTGPDPDSRPLESVRLRRLRSSGNQRIQSPTTSNVPAPPSTTAPTGPNSAAVAPDSNSPSWLLAPMKIALTALTRPRISSGVSSCTSVWRTTTLTMSTAPLMNSATIDSQNQCERPNTMVVTPKMATHENRMVPARLRMVQRASTSDISNAPMAGAPRSRPRPSGPTCRMSRA